MNIYKFLKLVEIQTKVASVIPFFIGSFYTIYRYKEFNLKNATVMFLSMIIFDMTVTAINNYMDYKKAIKKDGYGYEHHNAIVKYKLNPKVVNVIIILMLIIASILGMVLVKNTNIIVLFIGIISFIIGISYSFGPIPISRTPFGEVFSGLAMGFIITFLSIYIHIFDNGMLSIDFINLNNVTVNLNIIEIIKIILVSSPSVIGIANIMLANNICDIEEDIENKRFTLPIYIGKEKALILFKNLYYIGFILIIISILLNIIPSICLITLLSIKIVQVNISKFNRIQTKKDTFVLSVKNFIIINFSYAITILVSIIF